MGKSLFKFSSYSHPEIQKFQGVTLSCYSRLVVHVRRHRLKKASRRCTLNRTIAVVKQLRRSRFEFLAIWI
jgi:hypothetical protein